MRACSCNRCGGSLSGLTATDSNSWSWRRGRSWNRCDGRLRRADLRFVPFGDSLPEAIRQIRAAACDLIYYWEVGSDAMNYFLPFARLAPVQCTGWASTITSGVPAVDYFLSSELIETPGSESSIRRGSGNRRRSSYASRVCRPSPPASAADFGLPDDRRLYVCFQNPLKIHPDTDALFAGDPGRRSRGR